MRCCFLALFLCSLIILSSSQTFQYSRGWTNGKRDGSMTGYDRNFGRQQYLEELKRGPFGTLEDGISDNCSEKLMKCVIRMQQAARALTKNKIGIWSNRNIDVLDHYTDNLNNDSHIKNQDKRHQSTDSYYEGIKGRDTTRLNTEDEITKTDDYQQHL